MKLVADSGATKTLWYRLDAPDQPYFTKGCHPYYWTTAELTKSLQEELLPQLPKGSIEAVYFYGAGCSQKAPRAIVQAALQALFPSAQLNIESDLLAAARATAQHQAGICCILGTGSASVQYDGQHIVDQVPSLGYLLGDEGSGADLGRQLLRAYYYRQLPAALQEAFEAQYNTDKYTVLQALQQAAQPSRHLAQYTEFAIAQQAHPFIQELIKRRFGLFLERQVGGYTDVEGLPLHFVGSVAFGFRGLLGEVLAERGLELGQVLKGPFPALLGFYG